MRSRLKSIGAFAATILFAILGSILSQNPTLQKGAADFSGVLRQYPVKGGALYIVLSVLVTVSGIPFALIDLAAAWVYPYPVALVMLFVAKTIGSVLCFIVARTVLPARHRQNVLSHPTIAKVNRLLARGPVYYGTLCRMASMPAFVKNYGLASLSAISLPQYLFCCVNGSIVFVPLQAMLGSQLGGLYLGLVQLENDQVAAPAIAACVGIGALLLAMRKIIPVLLREEDDVERLRQEMDASVCICILGGTSFQGEDSEELVKAVARDLSAIADAKTCFVTGGMAGVQKTFAEHCGDGSRVWNLLPVGQSSGFSHGKDVHAGTDLQQRMHVFGQLGDIYVTVEGGPGVAQEARTAAARGAGIVPLMRTGGASAGMFDFPPSALQAPGYVAGEQWGLLADKGASVEASAGGVAAIVASMVKARGGGTGAAEKKSQ